MGREVFHASVLGAFLLRSQTCTPRDIPVLLTVGFLGGRCVASRFISFSLFAAVVCVCVFLSLCHHSPTASHCGASRLGAAVAADVGADVLVPQVEESILDVLTLLLHKSARRSASWSRPSPSRCHSSWRRTLIIRPLPLVTALTVRAAVCGSRHDCL